MNDTQLQLLESNLHVPGILSDDIIPQDLNMPDYDLIPNGQQWREVVEPGNIDHLFSSLNWLWPFDEGSDQIATPTGRPGLP